jgi:2-phosphosulfolactate phosphatase
VTPPGFDLGNSPQDADPATGADLVLATTNGAPAIVAAAEAAGEVVLAALLNLDAVVAAAGGRDVLLVCAGTDGGASVEDAYVAGRISAALAGPRTDAARIAEAVAAAYPDAADAIGAGAGARNLRAVGLEADVAFCSRESRTATVPRVIAMEDGVAVLTAAAYDLEKKRCKGLDNVLDATESTGVA